MSAGIPIAELPPAPQLPLIREPQAGPEKFARRRRTCSIETWQRLKNRAEKADLDPRTTLVSVFGDALGAWCKDPRFTLMVLGDQRPIAIDADPSTPLLTRATELTRQLHAGQAAPRNDVLQPFALGCELGHDGQGVLVHHVSEVAGALVISWDTVDALFPPGLIDDLVDYHAALLSRLAEDDTAWNRPPGPCLPERQRAVRDEVNSTTQELPPVLLHELFWAQASRTPDAIAVIAEDRSLSYRELRAGASALAESLRGLGAEPGRLVAVVMDKGWQQPLAALGILEAGAAYVPIEPDLPEERFHYLLGHSRVEIAVVTADLVDALSWPDGVRRVVVEESLFAGTGDEEGDAQPSRRQSPDDLAYVIYTSGSTGLPKGVMISHRNALNTVLDINRRFHVAASDRMLALTPLSFDLSVYDLFGPFAVGGTLVMPAPGSGRAPWHWADLLERHGVTLWNTVPALMEMLTGYTLGRRDRLPDSLRLVMLSGDWLAVSLPDRIRDLAGPDISVVSLGGATEASIWSIWYPIGEVDPSWTSIPYGKALTNQVVEVLDAGLRRRPDWVPGEQYIGGAGVAMGYLHDEAKTSRAFITHPETGQRLYRTGDLGRCHPDGNIEFLGREDFQVKVHGYRIELGEIEAALLGHQEVRAAVVTAIGDPRGEKRLIGYVTAPEIDGDALVEQLREYLAGRLPAHMVPAHIMVLEELPLTRNGKVDRAALPMPGRRAR